MVGILSSMMTETHVADMMPHRQRRYGIDLTDAELQIIASFLASKTGPGAPRSVETRRRRRFKMLGRAQSLPIVHQLSPFDTTYAV